MTTQKTTKKAYPSYEVMIGRAIVAINHRAGSSRYAIYKWIAATYPVPDKNLDTYLGRSLKRLVGQGKLIKVKASYKLSPSAKRSPATKAKRSPATKAKTKAKKLPIKKAPPKKKLSAATKAKKETPKTLYVAVLSDFDPDEKGVDRYPSTVVGTFLTKEKANLELLRTINELEKLEVFTDYTEEEMTKEQLKVSTELDKILENNTPVSDQKYEYFLKHGTTMQDKKQEEGRYWDGFIQEVTVGKNMY